MISSGVWPKSMIIRNASQLVCVGGNGERTKTKLGARDLSIIQNGAVILHDKKIQWVGHSSDLPPVPPDTEVLDATGKVVLPGFVDSHTHLVFAGSRENEFEQRLRGMTYQEIAAAGGGINTTVRRGRGAAQDELKAMAPRGLGRVLGVGGTPVEVQIGSGL